jgi:hypothetical protein
MPSQEELERMAQKMTEAQKKILEAIPSAAPGEETSDELPLDEASRILRDLIKDISASTRQLMNHSSFLPLPKNPFDQGEAKANIMLAFRHLEDARMRLGKVIQAFDGGTSVYDK